MVFKRKIAVPEITFYNYIFTHSKNYLYPIPPPGGMVHRKRALISFRAKIRMYGSKHTLILHIIRRYDSVGMYPKKFPYLCII
jgi:hypothetical protein